jgi:hypothetical protein
MAGAENVVMAPAGSKGVPGMRVSLTAHDEVLAGGEDVDGAEEEGRRSDAHVGEKDLGGFGPLLAGFVNLGRGHGLGEGKVGVLHHHPPQQSDEQDAERTADGHQRHRFPVAIGEIERGPDAREHEGRDGEHRSGRYRLADRTDGSGHVLFENRPLHQPQDGHADHRGGIGGGDGHAGAQAEVEIGRAENDGHHQA